MIRCLLLVALLAGGCAPHRDPPITAAEAARLRERCPPSTFMGSMTSSCPEIVR
jgi:hypothetical protein